MNIVRAIVLFPFLVIITLVSAVWNVITSVAWLAVLLFIIGAVLTLVGVL